MADDARRAAVLSSINSALPPQAAAARLCQACVSLLTLDAAGVSLRPPGGPADAMLGSSAALAATVAELQFTLGEGPSFDAVAHNRAVLAPDLELEEARWPVFTAAVIAEGVAAMFAFPVRLGEAAVGSLDLLRARPGGMSGDDLDLADYAAQLVTGPLRDWMFGVHNAGAAADEGLDDVPDDDFELQRVEVYQATGMLIGQMGVTAEEALLRLRAYAYRRGVAASEVARWIVSKRLRFTPDGEPVDAEESTS